MFGETAVLSENTIEFAERASLECKLKVDVTLMNLVAGVADDLLAHIPLTSAFASRDTKL